MAPAWGRAWRSKISSTAHGGNTGEDDDRRSLQPPTAGWSESTTTSGTTTTTGTTSSGPVVREPSFDFFQHRSTAAVVEEIGEEEKVKKLEHIKALVVRFPSDDSTPERWLSELQVNWVLHLAHVSEFGRSFISGQLLYFARSWILAFLEITKSVYLQFGGGWCISKEEDGDGPPPASEFKRFVEATWSKMLPFVDAIVAVRTCLPDDRQRRAEEPADEKLQALILLRDALSTAEEILLHDALPTASEQSISACAETLDLLSVELLMAKLDEAVWDKMEETKACVMSSWRGTPRSPDIHPIARSFISYIKVLWDNYGSVYRILHTDNENANHLTDLTIEMVRSLEEKLTEKSQSFPDQSLNFLFLINNFHFVLQQLWPYARARWQNL